ncbi:MAG: class II glutamine amidotransferase [Bacteroidota bacterium]
MSEQIKHECGIALLRLLKPMEYYLAKYGNTMYGLNKLYLLMEKQHNRGQDGAGVVNIKFDVEPGYKYINRQRSISPAAIKEIFSTIYQPLYDLKEKHPERLLDVDWLKHNIDFTGELFLGHLRYGTFGKNSLQNTHPFVRLNNWMTKNLVLAGNFNLTNVDELFKRLIEIGQHPVETSDTVTVLEKIGNYLDEANEVLFKKYKAEGYSKKQISPLIAKNLDVQEILQQSCKHWDGGYVIAGLMGHGDAFVIRDPSGIRPAFYYRDEEVVVVTSERPVIQTVFNVPFESVHELTPGNALIIKRNGDISEKECIKPLPKKSCSFERIYFSRGTDKEIYRERKKLGKLLSPSILKAINHDFENTVFSYIPNTAADAFNGLCEELNVFCNFVKRDKLMKLGANPSAKDVDDILKLSPRVEKVAVKDAKLRTFITEDSQRDDLVAHVYDITYGTVRKGIDNLVVLDDSIVRGTTLKQSILKILDRLGPKKIVIASSAPQLRYPDCYGIDMAKLNDFIAFKAAIALLKDTHQEHIINEVYKKSKAQENYPKEEIVNYVREIYKPFTIDQMSNKISELLTPKDIRAEVQIVYQTIEDLHDACPQHIGDWYFTGKYPTPGGNKVVNKAFLNFIEGKTGRAY